MCLPWPWGSLSLSLHSGQFPGCFHFSQQPSFIVLSSLHRGIIRSSLSLLFARIPCKPQGRTKMHPESSPQHHKNNFKLSAMGLSFSSEVFCPWLLLLTFFISQPFTRITSKALLRLFKSMSSCALQPLPFPSYKLVLMIHYMCVYI